MRGLLTLIVILGAYISINLTGNYLRVKRWIIALAIGTVVAEGYLSLVKYGLLEYRQGLYQWLFAFGSAIIALAAVAIAMKCLATVPDEFRAGYIVLPIILAVITAYSTSFPVTVTGVTLILLACVLGVVGIQTLFCAIGHMNEAKERAPYQALGILWICQSVVFAMLASGFVENYPAWEQYGEWLPASVLCAGLLRLSWMFLTEGRGLKRVTL